MKSWQTDTYLFFKASRKVDVLVATKMNISSIGVHSLMRVWNGWEKANMNTCHFGGEIKADSSTDIAWNGGTSYQDNSMKDAQSVGKAVRHALLLWKSGLATFRYWLSRLRDCKSQRCGERSEGGAEGGAYSWKKKSLHPTLVGRKTKVLSGKADSDGVHFIEVS